MKRLGNFIVATALCALAFAAPLSAQDALGTTDWWKLSDQQFAEQFAPVALGDDVAGQSVIAWALFARVNQQMPFQDKTVSVWELWPSDTDTFSGAVKFRATNKVRIRPHLQDSKAAGAVPHFKSTPDSAGEEVTRNLISYGYIVGNGLNTQTGVLNRIASGKQINLPIGATEIKAFWGRGATNGAYQFVDTTTQPETVYSLLGLHIMAKFAPTPSSPFYSENPSWFWTTFEFAENPGLKNAQSLLTYKDVVTPEQAQAILGQAGLGTSPFVNYRSNGTQIRYSDKANPKILLGNTKMEAFASVPASTPPSQWTAWNTSCHTCHGTAAIKTKGGMFDMYPTTDFPNITGTLKNRTPSLDEYTSMDFVWAIPFFAR